MIMKKRQIYILAMIVSFFGMRALDAAPHSPPSWRHNDDDRIQARLLAWSNHGHDSNQEFSISGKDNPELILPFELYRTLIQRAYAHDASVREFARRTYAKRGGQIVNEAFWTRLEAIAKPYIEAGEASRESVQAVRAESDERKRIAIIETLDKHECYARARSLADAREEFGDDAFLRFLYEAVAPDVSLYGDYDTMTNSLRLKQIAGGCE